MNWLERTTRLARTVAHLRPVQVAYQLRRRMLPAVRPRAPAGLHPRAGLVAPSFTSVPVPSVAPGQISFLNSPAPLDARRVDWRARAQPKLWRYNLHYFDYLHWPMYTPETKAALIDSWIAGNPVGEGDAWEPYPVSLRVVNWIRYFVASAGRPLPEEWLRSLALQLHWLEGNLEYHLLANHILKNAKALVFGGAFFTGAQAERLLRKGVELMVAEAREQVLPDGGHFERSLMYHCIALEDLLDVVSLASAGRDLVHPAALQELRDAAGRALQFLHDLRCGDGEMPLFNDAAFGITAPAAGLLAQGRTVLGLEAGGADAGQALRICKPDTGYFGYRKGEDSFIIDCGPVGPDYQPGHAHCDTLSYELCLDGRRLVVDSGMHDYENGALRNRLRGTAAHNTVGVDGAEQSEIWGAFRVARRARPLYADLGPWQGCRLEFRGAHDGYRRLPGRVTHERFVTMDAGGAWAIMDNLTGSGQHRVQSYINFHPRCSVKPLGPMEFRLDYDGAPVARLAVKNECRIELTSGLYCPEFGLKQQTTTMVLCSNASLPIRLGYAIERA